MHMLRNAKIQANSGLNNRYWQSGAAHWKHKECYWLDLLLLSAAEVCYVSVEQTVGRSVVMGLSRIPWEPE